MQFQVASVVVCALALLGFYFLRRLSLPPKSRYIILILVDIGCLVAFLGTYRTHTNVYVFLLFIFVMTAITMLLVRYEKQFINRTGSVDRDDSN
jgi:hypothetical protein